MSAPRTATETGAATTIPVGGAAPYDVSIGPGALAQVAGLAVDGTRAAVVHDEAVAGYAERVAAALDTAGVRVRLLPVPGGEAAKDVTVLTRVWEGLAAAGVRRDGLVVAVGGGATTDVAGFAAATWLRGVRLAMVPTTLLGMVDAAVGGKTGINTSAGKNLVGAFHPPAGVFVDLDVLAELPQREWVNGMPEVVKAGFIADPAILALVEGDLAGAARADGPHARELVERAIAVKAAVVTEDLREAGAREMLNYGHTLGHAIELVEDYRLPHGHAVSIGLVFAAALGRLSGRLDAVTADRHRSLLDLLGLPTSYPADAWPQLRTAMSGDKKARGERLRFVVLDGLARPGILDDPADRLLEEAYAEVAR